MGIMFRITQIIALVLGLAIAASASQNTIFEPEDGRKLFIVGQDLDAVGGKPFQNNVPITPVFGGGLTGVPALNDGYVDHFPMPAGITSYSTIPELWGLDTIVDYGAGLLYADTYKQFEQFEGTALSLGLAFIGQSEPIADGVYDAQIVYLANWLKNFGRPVFLRIGFEFDYGPNQYGGPSGYIPAYRHIVDVLRAEGVTNVAYVWQGLTANSGSGFFPGADYVDWISFSAFSPGGAPPSTYTNGNMFKLAEIHDKPVMIAEMATNGVRLESANGNAIWRSYFQPWLDMIESTDRIKAVAWINQDWQTQPLWADLRFWDNTNTRLQDNEIVKQNWTEAMEGLPWIQAEFENVFDAIRLEESKYDNPAFDIIDNVVEGGTGLRATYFSGTEFEEEVLTVDENVNINIIGGRSPYPEVPRLNYSARWIGNLVAPNTGTYTILTTSDDGIRVWANDTIQIDNWTPHARTTDFFKLDMVAGEPVPIIIEYFQGFGSSVAILEWRGPNFGRKLVEPNFMFPEDAPTDNTVLEITDGTGLTTTYFDGTDLQTPVLEGLSNIDFSLGFSGSPAEGVPSDFFSVRWEGYLVPPASGNFEFYFTVDDGARVWFDDQLMVDEFVPGSTREINFSYAMQAGQPVKILVEYFENFGGAVARLEWVSTSWSAFLPREVVGTNYLFPIDEIPQVIDDDTPTAFSFAEITDAPVATSIESESVIISGINIPVDVSIVGGEYSINDGAFTSEPTTLENGDALKLRLVSADSMGTTLQASVTVGQSQASFSVTTVAADSEPDAFELVDQLSAPLDSEILSNTITISGINVSLDVSIVGGEYSINAGAFTTEASSVVDGDTIQVRLNSAATEATTTIATLTVGSITEDFSVQTEGIIGPDAFSFDPIIDAATSSFVTSNEVTISGLSGVSPITITNGEYSIDGGSFTSAEGSIDNGQTLQLRVFTTGFSETSEATVTVNDITTSFTVTTEAEDATPAPFSFTNISDADPSTTYTSNAITVAEINSSVAISISGGAYSINGGPFESISSSVTTGDSVVVQVESSSEFSTEATATLTIGGVTADFSVTTTAIDITPSSFELNTITNAELETEYTSTAITVSDVNASTAVSIEGGEFSVNGGAFTSADSLVELNDEVVVRLLSSAEFDTTVNATLTIGGVSATFSVTTMPIDATPNSISFDNLVDVIPGTLATSNVVTVTGINTAVAISIVGGEFSINGGVYSAAAATVVSGDQISVRLSSSTEFETTVTATLSIGDISADFSVTTEAPAPTRGDFGIENSGDGSGIIYFRDEGWTGRWNFVCLNDHCTPGQLVGEYWERSTSGQFAGGLTPGGSYNIQLKVQDDQTGQFISPNYPVVFE